MVDIQTVSIVIASASVVAGIVYYALQLRHQTKIRQTDLVMRLYSVHLRGWCSIRAELPAHASSAEVDKKVQILT